MLYPERLSGYFILFSHGRKRGFFKITWNVVSVLYREKSADFTERFLLCTFQTRFLVISLHVNIVFYNNKSIIDVDQFFVLCRF